MNKIDTVIILIQLFSISGESLRNRRTEKDASPSSQLLSQADPGKIRAHGVDLDKESDHEIFLSANFSLVEAHKGSDATLNCRVRRNSDFGTISWFKRELDGRVILLAVGDETYIADSRFAVFRPVLSMNWSLQIRGVHIDDAGEYLCQTSQHPPSSVMVRLAVTEAWADIVGSEEKVFRAGTSVQLVCVIRDVTQPPSFIFWYHNKRMINYDQGDGVQVEVSGVSNKSMKSVLTMTNIAITQAGTYTCSPSMARPDSVNVTVKHHEQALPEPVVNSEANTAITFPELLLFTILTLIIKVF